MPRRHPVGQVLPAGDADSGDERWRRRRVCLCTKSTETLPKEGLPPAHAHETDSMMWLFWKQHRIVCFLEIAWLTVFIKTAPFHRFFWDRLLERYAELIKPLRSLVLVFSDPSASPVLYFKLCYAYAD